MALSFCCIGKDDGILQKVMAIYKRTKSAWNRRGNYALVIAPQDSIPASCLKIAQSFSRVPWLNVAVSEEHFQDSLRFASMPCWRFKVDEALRHGCAPAMIVLIVPLPSQSSTFTATILASLATPTVRPAATDATCVPCPSQSDAFQSLLPSEKSHLQHTHHAFRQYSP